MGPTKLILIPFFAGLVAASVFSRLEPVAEALDCVPDEYWVVDEVVVEGEAVPWPGDGHLYPNQLSLWTDGYSVDVEYAP